MASENGNGNQPWWVNPVVKAPLSALALYLVYVLVTTIQSDVRAILEVSNAHHSYSIEVFRRLEQSLSENTPILRATCIAQSRQAGTDERECLR